MVSKKKSGLGSDPFGTPKLGIFAPTEAKQVASAQKVPIDSICFPKKQPRRYFDPDKLAQLTASIKRHGIIEPLLVRPLPDGKYELVAGERRWRAAKAVGLTDVPIVVRELDDQEALQLALEENLQREDLNPFEEVQGILDLLSLKLQCSQDEILDILKQAATAQKKGKQVDNVIHPQLEEISKTLESLGRGTPEGFYVNRVPVLRLPEEVAEALRQDKLSYNNAKAVALLKDEAPRKILLKEAVEQGLSVQQIKDRIKQLASAEEVTTEPVLSPRKRLSKLGSRIEKLWSNPKKRKQIEGLLARLETLVAEESKS